MDRAGMHGNETRDGIQRRGLAAAIGAEQRHHAALGHFQRDVGHPDQVGSAHLQLLELERQSGHVATPPISSIAVWPAAAFAAGVPGSAAVTAQFDVTSRGLPRAIALPGWNTMTRLASDMITPRM